MNYKFLPLFFLLVFSFGFVSSLELDYYADNFSTSIMEFTGDENITGLLSINKNAEVLSAFMNFTGDEIIIGDVYDSITTISISEPDVGVGSYVYVSVDGGTNTYIYSYTLNLDRLVMTRPVTSQLGTDISGVDFAGGFVWAFSESADKIFRFSSSLTYTGASTTLGAGCGGDRHHMEIVSNIYLLNDTGFVNTIRVEIIRVIILLVESI